METLINKWKNTVDQHNKKLNKLRDDSSNRSKSSERVTFNVPIKAKKNK